MIRIVKRQRHLKFLPFLFGSKDKRSYLYIIEKLNKIIMTQIETEIIKYKGTEFSIPVGYQDIHHFIRTLKMNIKIMKNSKVNHNKYQAQINEAQSIINKYNEANIKDGDK